MDFIILHDYYDLCDLELLQHKNILKASCYLLNLESPSKLRNLIKKSHMILKLGGD